MMPTTVRYAVRCALLILVGVVALLVLAGCGAQAPSPLGTVDNAHEVPLTDVDRIGKGGGSELLSGCDNHGARVYVYRGQGVAVRSDATCPITVSAR